MKNKKISIYLIIAIVAFAALLMFYSGRLSSENVPVFKLTGEAACGQVICKKTEETGETQQPIDPFFSFDPSNPQKPEFPDIYDKKPGYRLPIKPIENND